jgi:uncharacterized protein (DUF4415 family)
MFTEAAGDEPKKRGPYKPRQKAEVEIYCRPIRGGDRPAGSSALGGWMTSVKEDTRKYSLDELREMREREETETRADASVLSLDAEFWDNTCVVMPPRGKSSIHLRIDSDVLEWFKAQGRGHLTRMNAVLRSFMEAHKQHRPR